MNYVEFPDRKGSDKNESTKEKKNRSAKMPQGGGSWMWGLVCVICLLLLLNYFITPLATSHSVKNTDYGTFVTTVESGKVKQVVIQENQIYYTTADKTYRTGAVDDPGLVDRLLEASSPNDSGKIEFVQKVQSQQSPIVQFLLWWILPGLLFYLMFRAMSRRIGKGNGGMGMGMGNFMSFGQSGAKVYADTDVKTRFADVAGQDEAKASLQEMVDFLHDPKKFSALGA